MKKLSLRLLSDRSYKIAVAGTGYVGLSLAVLLAQHNEVTAVDILPEKVESLNKYISPIQDDYIEKYLAEAKEGKRTLNLKATFGRRRRLQGCGLHHHRRPYQL